MVENNGDCNKITRTNLAKTLGTALDDPMHLWWEVHKNYEQLYSFTLSASFQAYFANIIIVD